MDWQYPANLTQVRTSDRKNEFRNPEQAVEGGLATVPAVGNPLNFFGEGGRLITTSIIVSIDWEPEGFKAETLNSVYSLKLKMPGSDIQKLQRESEALSKGLEDGSVIFLDS